MQMQKPLTKLTQVKKLNFTQQKVKAEDALKT
jgi:hypothetical protein